MFKRSLFAFAAALLPVAALAVNAVGNGSVSVPVPVNQGGTSLTGTSAGDLLFAATNGALSSLPVGSNGQVLTVVSGLPAWATGGGGGTGATTTTTADFNTPTGPLGSVVISVANSALLLVDSFLVINTGSGMSLQQFIGAVTGISGNNVTVRQIKSTMGAGATVTSGATVAIGGIPWNNGFINDIALGSTVVGNNGVANFFNELGNSTQLTGFSGDSLAGVSCQSLEISSNSQKEVCIDSADVGTGDIGVAHNMNLLGGLIPAQGSNAVVAYPWHPASDPSCAIGAGGTGCTTSSITLPAANMRCTANPQGNGTLGGILLVGTSITYPDSTHYTITENAVATIAGGGTVTFSSVCT